MWVRKRLDIGWSDLAFAACRALWQPEKAASEWQFQAGPISRDNAELCLSVRSGFELLLGTLNLPPGSEVLLSALTIPDMPRIVERRGLVPVPVDLDPETMAPTPETVQAAIGPASRMLVVAHLFGSRMPLEPILQLARSHGLFVVEDCAQAFDGQYFGHSDADVSLLSFGPIKTATALGGGILRASDARLVQEVRLRHRQWPVQDRSRHLRRAAKYAGLKIASSRPVLGGWIKVCELLGRDFDRIANSAARGFAGPDFFARIRQRPSLPLMATLARRIRRFDGDRLASQITKGRLLARLLSDRLPCPAAHSPCHTFWAFPIRADNPAALIVELRKSGFDATQGSSLFVVRATNGRPGLRARMSEAILPQIVYLPLYAEMPDRAIRDMAGVVLATAKAASLPDVEQPTPPTQRGSRVRVI